PAPPLHPSTLSLHDALPICVSYSAWLLVDLLEHVVPILPFLGRVGRQLTFADGPLDAIALFIDDTDRLASDLGDVAFLEKHEPADRKSTRLNSSHRTISYAV